VLSYVQISRTNGRKNLVDVQKTIEFLLEQQAAAAARQATHDAEIAEIRKLIHEMIGGINSLLTVAESHERRLSRLEGEPES
jgi:hypothetical protein